MNSCYNIIGSTKEISSFPASLVQTIGTFGTGNLSGILAGGNQPTLCVISDNGQNIFVMAYTGTNTQGFYSTNGGISFTGSNFITAGNTLRITKISANSTLSYMLMCCSAVNSYIPQISTDYGATWSNILNTTATLTWDCCINEDGLFMGYTKQGANGIYVSRTNGLTWTQYLSGNQIMGVGCDSTGNVIFSGANNSNIYSSINGGVSFTTGTTSNTAHRNTYVNANYTLGGSNLTRAISCGAGTGPKLEGSNGSFTSWYSIDALMGTNGVYAGGTNANQFSISGDGKRMVTSTILASNNLFYTTDGTTWSAMGSNALYSTFQTIAITNCYVSKNGQYWIFSQNTAGGNMYKVYMP